MVDSRNSRKKHCSDKNEKGKPDIFYLQNLEAGLQEASRVERLQAVSRIT